MDDENFRAFFSKNVKISNDDLDKILEYSFIENIPSGSYYVEFDEVCNKVSFVTDGFFRFFHYNDGNEVTRDFVFKNNFITSYRSFITGEPSGVYVQALENSTLITFLKKDLNLLYSHFPQVERLSRIIAEHQFVAMENYYLSFLNDSAETRYHNLLAKNPILVQKIPLKYLASFLGITPQHLSRLRKK